jgi:hypothetical protein
MTLDDIMSKVRIRSSYVLTLGEQKIGYVTFLKGSVAMMPLHFLHIITRNQGEYEDIVLTSATQKRSYKILIRDFLDKYKKIKIEDFDLLLVHFRHVEPHINILPYFVDAKYYAHRNAMDVCMLHPDSGNKNYSRGILSKNDVGITGTDGDTATCDVVLATRFVTRPGDCGAMVFLVDSSSGHQKIISMHIAGSENRVALSSVFAFTGIKKALESWNQVSDLNDMFKSQCVNVTASFGHEPAYTVNDRIFMPQVSCIIPSKIYGCWGPALTKPGYMQPFMNECGDVVDPLAIAISKYHVPQRPILEENILNACVDNYFETIQQFSPLFSAPSKNLLTFEEAVIGIPGLPFYDSLPRNSSPGYPDQLHSPPNKRFKHFWFGSDGEYTIDSPPAIILRKEVEQMLNLAKVNQLSNIIFKDFLKDARLPIAKADKGKARLVSGAPQAYVIACRMYFMSFTAWFMTVRVHNGCAVGINAYSEEWDQLHRYLSFFTKILAGDFSGFDTCHSLQLFVMVLDLINKWYDDSPENQRVRAVLFWSKIRSKHICGRMVYYWHGALPSGDPLTVIINSLIHLIIIRYVFVLIVGLEQLSRFNNLVRVCTYGDDGVYTAHDEIVDEFNQNSVAKAYAIIGYTFTTEDKGDQTDVLPYRPISEVSFLKRRFVYLEEACRVVAPLNLDTVLEIPYWVKKNNDIDEQTAVNCKFAFRELTLHGPTMYEEWSLKIKRAFENETGAFMLIPNYRNLLDEVLSQDFSFIGS